MPSTILRCWKTYKFPPQISLVDELVDENPEQLQHSEKMKELHNECVVTAFSVKKLQFVKSASHARY